MQSETLGSLRKTLSLCHDKFIGSPRPLLSIDVSALIPSDEAQFDKQTDNQLGMTPSSVSLLPENSTSDHVVK